MSCELLTNEQMKQADSLTIAAGVPGTALMEAAGKAVADYIKAHYAGLSILILCGPGNNGGDGFITAHFLQGDGVDVTLACLVDPAKLKGDAAWAAGVWTGEVKSFENLEILANTVIVDAVFGTGFDRALELPVSDLFEKIKKAGCPVVAVDIPSGVNGNTGAADAAVLQAQASITFFRKRGFYIHNDLAM